MRKRPLCMVCLILLAIQLVRVSFLQNTKDQKPSLAETLISDEKDVICEGTVYKIENKSQSTAIYLKDAVVSCTDQKSKNQIIKEKKILVTIKNNKSGKKNRMKIGQKLNVWGTKQSFHPPRNPGNFNQKSYYQKQGIHVGVLTKAEQVEIVLSEKDKNWIVSRWNSIRNQLDRLKNYWNWKIVSQMGKTHGAMLSAILLGEKSGLDPEMKKLYQKNGLGHLLAISGLHMSLIGMSVYRLLRKMGNSFLFSGIAGGGILFFYLVMTGPQVSSLRALLMFFIRMGAEITGRDVDQPTSLAVTAAILSIYQPLYLLDAAFLLSFDAILGILLLYPIFEQKTRLKAWEGFKISLAVNGMLLGIMLYYYFEVPPYALVLNVILIPLFPFVMLTGIGGLLFSELSGTVGKIGFRSCDRLLSFYDKLCELTSALPGSRIVTGQPELWWVLIYYGVLLFLCFLFHAMKNKTDNRRKQAGFSLLVCIVIAGSICGCGILNNDSKNLQVTVLDVGQGDCIFIRDREGKKMLVDGGSSDLSSVGTYRIEPFLLSQGVRKLEYVFVTHGDADHINGIQELLQNQKQGVEIDALVLPPEEYMDEKLLHLAEIAKENGTRVLTIYAGEKVGTYLKCIAPLTTRKNERIRGKEEEVPRLEAGNEASVVLELKDGAFQMLLTGDLEGRGEEQLVESGALESCPILKAGHHGSKNSGSEEFLQIVKPRLTLISAGIENRYGHPHEETLERLQEIGSEVLSTQECGAITLRSDGRKIKVHKYL